MARAFAYYDFDNGSAEAPGTMRLVYTPGVVQPKYFNNDTNFAPGFRTPDDHWENRWRKGQNSLLDWDAGLPGQGEGAKSMGQELGNSGAFAQLPGREGVQDGVLPRAGRAATPAKSAQDSPRS